MKKVNNNNKFLKDLGILLGDYDATLTVESCGNDEVDSIALATVAGRELELSLGPVESVQNFFVDKYNISIIQTQNEMLQLREQVADLTKDNKRLEQLLKRESNDKE